MGDNGRVKAGKIRKARSNGARGNASKATSPQGAGSGKHRLPSHLVDLTPAERRFLKDPNWIDEDESDLLLAIRREAEEGEKAIPFDQVLKEFGYKLDDFLPARRKGITASSTACP